MLRILWSILLCLISAILVFLFQNLWFVYRQKERGCKSAKKYPHKDPFLGLDLFLKNIKCLSEHRLLPEAYKRHAELGATYETINMGKRNVHTVEPQNLRVIFSTDSTRWGVQPARFKEMGALFGRGLVTCDGSV